MYIFDGENVSFVQSANAYDDKVVTSKDSKLKVVTLDALVKKASETDKSFGE